jgi:hypothetical protein
MNRARLALAMLGVLLLPLVVQSADLARIDRKIANTTLSIE